MKKYSLFLFIFVLGFSGIINANTIFASGCTTNSTLQLGSTGDDVACLQARLGVPADGKFGLITKSAVIALQNNFGLNPDGVFDRKASTALWGDNFSETENVSANVNIRNTDLSDADDIQISKPVSSFATVYLLSPSGGEKWKKGTIRMIRWEDSISGARYDITIIPYYPPCHSKFCAFTRPYHVPYTIATNVPDFLYEWEVGKVEDSSTSYVPDGSYTFQVCQTGTDNCYASSIPTKILSSDDVDPPSIKVDNDTDTKTKKPTSSDSDGIVLVSPTGGERLTKGSTQAIEWQDAKSGARYQINLAPYYSPCFGKFCSIRPYHAPYVIASNVFGFTYKWQVGRVQDANNQIVPDGLYTFEVCEINTDNCASSSVPSRILIGNDSNAPSITFVANPKSVNVGEESVLNWDSPDAIYCNATGGSNGWAGRKAPSGVFHTGPLYTEMTYVLTCVNGDDNISQSATTSLTVKVNQDSTISISPDGATVGYKAGSLPIAFNVFSNTTWTVSSNQPWISLFQKTGTGNSTVGFSYTANLGTEEMPSSARTAFITVSAGNKTATYTLIQNGTRE